MVRRESRCKTYKMVSGVELNRRGGKGVWMKRLRMGREGMGREGDGGDRMEGVNCVRL